MDLVIDANIVFSALISSEGKTAELLFSNKVKLFAPEFLFEEIEKYKEEIIQKSGLSEVEFDLALAIIKSKISVVPEQEFSSSFAQAEEVCPDPNDREYFALAISLHCSIWSNDKRLKNQNDINVISTTELLDKLNLIT